MILHLSLHFIIMEPPSCLLWRSPIPTILDITVIIGWALLQDKNVQMMLRWHIGYLNRRGMCSDGMLDHLNRRGRGIGQ